MEPAGRTRSDDPEQHQQAFERTVRQLVRLSPTVSKPSVINVETKRPETMTVDTMLALTSQHDLPSLAT